MVQARGRKTHLVMDFEQSFKQNPSEKAGVSLPFNSNALRATQPLVEDTVIRNNRNPAEPDRGDLDVNGQVVVPLDKRGFGHWLMGMFGEPETTGEGPYTHVFKPGDEQPSIMVERGYTDRGIYEQFNGCKISQLSLEVTGSGGSELAANIDITGAKATLGSTPYEASPEEIVLAKFNRFQASIKEAGALLGIASNFSLNINFDLDGDQRAIDGTAERFDIPEGTVQTTGTLRVFFTSADLMEKAINGTETSLEISFASGDDRLSFLLPEVQFERGSAPVEGKRGITLEMPFRAYYADADEESSIVVTLVNDVPSYTM